MTIIKKYRIWCVTQDKYVFDYRDDGTIPNVCPEGHEHVIDPNNIIQIAEHDEVQTVVIKEEDVQTGGHFASETVKIVAPKNTKTKYVQSWPYPISVLGVNFNTSEKNRNDHLSVTIGEDTIIGAIIAPVIPAQPWMQTNYKKNNIVTIVHPKYGNRVYTCIMDTVNNISPLHPFGVKYWTHGFKIMTSPTVLQYAFIGSVIKLCDGTDAPSMGRVISIDLNCQSICVEKNAPKIYSPLSPTYVRLSVCMLNNYTIGFSGTYVIGQSKIGGSYIPADTPINIYYVNKSPTENKEFYGSVEYLY